MRFLPQMPFNQHISSRVRDDILQHRNRRFDGIKLVSKKAKSVKLTLNGELFVACLSIHQDQNWAKTRSG